MELVRRINHRVTLSCTEICAKNNQEFLPRTTPTNTNHRSDFLQRVRGVRVVRGFFFLLFFCCLFFSCDEPKASGNLNGTWSAYDGYKIDAATKKIEYDGGDNSGYKADIVNSPDYEARNGLLIIKFTWYYEIVYSWEPPYNITSQGEKPEYENKYGAVYWKDLTVGSVQLGNAYNTSTWKPAMYNTLEEAQANFTIDKTGDYISQWGSFTK